MNSLHNSLPELPVALAKVTYRVTKWRRYADTRYQGSALSVSPSSSAPELLDELATSSSRTTRLLGVLVTASAISAGVGVGSGTGDATDSVDIAEAATAVDAVDAVDTASVLGVTGAGPGGRIVIFSDGRG